MFSGGLIGSVVRWFLNDEKTIRSTVLEPHTNISLDMKNGLPVKPTRIRDHGGLTVRSPNSFKFEGFLIFFFLNPTQTQTQNSW